MAQRFEQPTRLRSIEEITEALEWVWTEQKGGRIDPKVADGMNTTLKGIMYLRAKLPLDAAKIYVAAKKNKIDIPSGYLPTL